MSDLRNSELSLDELGVLRNCNGICNELELIWVTQIGLARLYHPKKVRIGQIMYGQPLKRFPMLPQVFAGVEGVGGVASLPVPCGPASNTFSGNKVV